MDASFHRLCRVMFVRKQADDRQGKSIWNRSVYTGDVKFLRSAGDALLPLAAYSLIRLSIIIYIAKAGNRREQIWDR